MEEPADVNVDSARPQRSTAAIAAAVPSTVFLEWGHLILPRRMPASDATESPTPMISTPTKGNMNSTPWHEGHTTSTYCETNGWTNGRIDPSDYSG